MNEEYSVIAILARSGAASQRRMTLILCQREVIDAFESHEGLQDGPELGHLFLAVESHEFVGNRPRYTTHKCPAVPQSQGQTTENVRLFSDSVGNSEQLPDRMSTQIVVFLPI